MIDLSIVSSLYGRFIHLSQFMYQCMLLFYHGHGVRWYRPPEVQSNGID